MADLDKIIRGTSENTSITSAEIVYIIKMIKIIQKRMKDPDCVNLEYIQLYDKLTQEFTNFSDDHTDIFTKVSRGEDLSTIAQVLYFRDKVNRNLIKESDLSDRLASKYLPKNLKADADRKMGELQGAR